MTNQQHPIVPDPELLQEWYDDKTDYFADMIRAAQWGADQELEAIQKEIITQAWFADPGHRLAQLRAARRPKPPSLKEQAMETLKYPKDLWSESEVDTIRRALEALPDD
jgi:hypothetical protein